MILLYNSFCYSLPRLVTDSSVTIFGSSSVGRTRDFDSRCQRFESFLPSHIKKGWIFVVECGSNVPMMSQNLCGFDSRSFYYYGTVTQMVERGVTALSRRFESCQSQRRVSECVWFSIDRRFSSLPSIALFNNYFFSAKVSLK